MTPAGLTLSHDFPGTFTNSARRIHFEPSKNLVYADNGQIINPAIGTVAGRFITPSFFDSTLMVADAAAKPGLLSDTVVQLHHGHFAIIQLDQLALVDSTTINVCTLM